MFYTYMHIRCDSGKPFYIGKGCDRRAWSKRSRSPHWHRIVRKHGHAVTVLARWESEDDAFAHEMLLIACLRNLPGVELVNLTDGGEGSSGRKLSEDVRAHMSNEKRGRPLSDEHRATIGRAQRGRFVSDSEKEKKRIAMTGRKKPAVEIAGYLPALREAMQRADVRQRISDAARGRVHSAEARAKMSASRVGLKQSPETRAKRSETIKATLAVKKAKGN